MKKDDQKDKLPQMDMNVNPIWDVLDGKVEPRKREKKKKLKKKDLPGMDENIDYYFSKLEKQEQNEDEHKKVISIFYMIILVVFVLIIAFIGLIAWKYDQLQVSSDSMAKQVMSDNRILYQENLTINRFNIVVVEQDNKKELLRVIGMPGDKISLREDVLTINDAIYDEDYLKENYVEFKLERDNRDQFYTKDFSVAELKDVNGETLHIPENKYLLLGDNRVEAKDSREVGFYNKSDIKGIAIMKIWPLTEIGPIK